MRGRIKSVVLALAVLLLPVLARAHPPVSLVMDSKGTLFYSDLTQVWMILPDGSKKIAVPNVHTHELWLSPDDVLYGEDVANVGERYRHRLWKRYPDGKIEDEIPWRQGYPDDIADYSFSRDAALRAYILRRAAKKIDVRSRAGELLRTIDFSHIDGAPHWLSVTSDGTIYLTAGATLLRVASGESAVKTLARNLIERTERFSFVHDRHALMGLWPDAAGAVYIAVFSGQMVKKITPGGAVSVVARSDGKWSVTGGLAAADGALWLLEWSTSNDARVRRIARDGEETLY